MEKILLNGHRLRINDIVELVQNPHLEIEVEQKALDAVWQAREFLEQEEGKRIIYGVNTGFGPMASHIINPNEGRNLQKNLIFSHAVGMGKPIASKYVLAAMIVRLNTLLQGYSGISKDLAAHLQKFINHRILPIVPEHGAVGTSGDLVQLAHLALAILGQGDVFYQGKRIPAKQALLHVGISPYNLKTKEGLSLINGTSLMTGIAAVLCARAEHLLLQATRLGAFALEAVQGFDDSISEKLHEIRPQEGQIYIARRMRELLSSSNLLSKRDKLSQPLNMDEKVIKIAQTVQEFYSLRCIPQILGPIQDTLQHAKKVVEIEMNSVSDNPAVDVKNQTFLHGGNFHGDAIATVVDQIKISLVKLTLLSERRTNFFLNHNINQFFPPFLNLDRPGLTLGLQGLQFVATSTTAQNQTLAFPHSIHSIPTNGDNQDVVSMGADAALFCAQVIENAFVVLAIELIALGQTVEFMGSKEKLSDSSKQLYVRLRADFPAVREDRNLTQELPRVIQLIKEGSV
jgi:histidine ammonia-lyase